MSAPESTAPEEQDSPDHRGPAHAAGAEPARVTVWRSPPLAAGSGAEAWLSPAEATRHGRYRHPGDAARFTTGRALARAALAEVLRVPAAEVEVLTNPLDGPEPGRPHSPGAPSFSIAHAGRWVLLAVAVRGAVGVDVEEVGAVAPHLAELVDAVPPGEAPPGGWDAAALTTSWVRREAVLKAVGTGLTNPRDDLLLGPAEEPARVATTAGVMPLVDELAVSDLALPALDDAPDDVRAAVALAGVSGPAGITVNVLDAAPLLARHGVREPALQH